MNEVHQKQDVHLEPKDKAYELVNRMFSCDKFTIETPMAMLYPHAKQCALIAVDEILKEYDKYLQSAVTKKYAIEYWEEVKHEIEQL